MNDTPRPGTSATGSVRKKSGKGVLFGLLAVVVAFAAGFLWQFYEATTVREQLTQAEQELAVERLRIRLGQAALAAQAGDYESARRQMSVFFTRLQEVGNELPNEMTGPAADFLAMRDDIITGLSRSNPEYAGVLYGMLEQMTAAAEEAAVGPGMPTGPGSEAAPRDTTPAEPATGGADTAPARPDTAP
ncbi:MAG: hypothetical protein ACOCVZ_09505 [Gemmatimonadota bacterium]